MLKEERMLPDCRKEGDIFSIPKFTVERKDVESFMEELRAFHGEFGDCFFRKETKENFFRYMVGQFSELERKSIEPIALSVENGAVRSMQRAVSDAVWDEDKMIGRYHGLVGEDLGDPQGVLIFDETGLQKKGQDSVGVAKQYCGSLGKVENCQVGVFAAYASRHGYAFLDKRLFMPEKWFTDEYEVRRKKCRVPGDLEFKTKPQLAVEIFEGLQESEDLPFRYVVADSIYGNSPDFIEAVEKCIDKTYFVSIPSGTKCWLKRPITRMRQYRYKGELRSKEVLEGTEKKPLSVSKIARNLNDFFWYRRKVSEGTKGPIEYEFSKREVILSKDGLPWKTVWLIMKRTVGRNPIYSFYISNAPRSTRLKTFVWLSGIRWAIEQCFEETKTELGMDQYEVRKFAGWNHHMLTCMLAHFFLWHLKIRLGKKSTCHYALAA
jgi:SRSO17 transposase